MSGLPRRPPGRPKALTQGQLDLVRQLLLQPGNTIVGIAQQLGTSRATIYRAYHQNDMTRVTGGLNVGGYWSHHAREWDILKHWDFQNPGVSK